MSSATAGDIAARLDRLPFSHTLRRMVWLISFGGGFEFYDIFLTAYIAPGLVAGGLFTSTSSALLDIRGVGFFVFATFSGMFIGAMGFGSIADRLGRRSIFVVSLVAYSLATAMMAFQHTALGVDIWRFLASIGVGVEQVTIDTFLPEFVPPTARGRAFALNQLIQFLFVPLVALLGWLLVPLHPWGLDGWRWVTLLGSAGGLLAWSLRLGIPESPRWLAARGRIAEAGKVLTRMEAGVMRDTGAPLPNPAVSDPEPADHPTGLADKSASSFAEIFRAPYGLRTLVMSIFNLMQSIAFYGFGSWVPTLLIAKGIRVTTSLEYAFIIAIANPAGPLLGWLVADRMERKWQIVSAGVAIGVSILLFANQTHPALVIAFGVMVTLANNWMSFAFHNYQAELFPTRIRARAVGFVYSWSRVSAAVAGLLIGFFLRAGGTPGVALFIGAAMVVMVVTIGGFGPRTKDLALEAISRR